MNRLFPDYIFESSWEVCNKVGGIYTVLSTRARTLQDRMTDRIIFIGPDCWGDKKCPYFDADETIFASWRFQAESEGLNVKVGRWNIPGKPIAILVDFKPFFEVKNEIYGALWADYQVDSLHGYGDYDEASMFSYAAGRVVESLYKFYLDKSKKVIYHANEWMTGLGLLYIQKRVPEIGTIWTTHATSIGRSIAGNNKPLYGYLSAYNGDQMAAELNMQSKHSIEKQAAWNCDCFTTVSDITATECAELMDKPCDVVLPNGFEDDFVPKAAAFTKKRKEARRRMLDVANALLGTELKDDTLIVSTSGRYEFRNKGIDVFIDAVNRLRFRLKEENIDKNVVAFIEVPAWVNRPRKDLKERLAIIGNNEKTRNKQTEKEQQDNSLSSLLSPLSSLDYPILTHTLHNLEDDRATGMMRYLDMWNRKDDRVKVIFVPCYLTGDDGIFNMTYYDLLLGHDLCVYPSYYEPWGYTPLEAIAFKVPCITTDLAGFGLWANKEFGHSGEITDGVKVIHRTDDNYDEVANQVCDTILQYAQLSKSDVDKARRNAAALSKKALWKKFIKYYEEAYDIALQKAAKR